MIRIDKSKMRSLYSSPLTTRSKTFDDLGGPLAHAELFVGDHPSSSHVHDLKTNHHAENHHTDAAPVKGSGDAKSRVRGMLTFDQLRSKIENSEIETVILGMTDHWGRLQGKRIDADFFLSHPETAACNYLLACDLDMNPIKGFKLFSWEKGFGDFVLRPAWESLRICSWHPKTALLLADVVDEEGHPIEVAPRSILKKQIQHAAEMGFTAKAASELEYYVYKQGYRQARAGEYKGLEPISDYVQDYSLLQAAREEQYHAAFRRHLKNSGVPVETTKGEAGKGQHELNIEYTTIMDMADRHTVYKQCLKEVADQLGVSLTFMAKPHGDQSGSSCHLHISLWNADGTSAFYDPNANWSGLPATPTFRYFLGGLIAHTPNIMPFYAPTINSYKRFTEGSWAPTRLAWCHDNRTAGFRVVGEGPAMRIEVRIPGADANIYLALASALACGLDGVANKIEPPEQFVGDVYSSQKLPRVARSLGEAVGRMDGSEFPRRAFGEMVVQHYTNFYAHEQAEYDKQVTDWEMARYFERI
eukprot:comp72129_c0_seq1/m.48165 comp72129_c0_seq1/g.48165  ORF comp72129_c0_seq1/g.48165 comp72129_c0_seq1/m.48165 type:complete len:530 (-) comp72129_c0_seq1:168-1757(-)